MIVPDASNTLGGKCYSELEDIDLHRDVCQKKVAGATRPKVGMKYVIGLRRFNLFYVSVVVS